MFADKIFFNADIYTLNNNMQIVDSIAIKEKKILAVGSYSNIKKYISDTTKIIDLNSKTVLPGLIDGHMHLVLHGENILKINLTGFSKNKIIKTIKKEASLKNSSDWIIGYGWSNDNWSDKSTPKKETLDKISPKNPVMLQRIDGHMIWVNSKALELAKIDKNTKNPEGGQILKTPDGELSGCLTDMAIFPIWSIAPISSDSFKKNAIIKVQKELLSYGITSCVNAGSTLDEIELFKKLYISNDLKIRIYNVLSGKWGTWLTDKEYKYIEKGIETNLFENKLTTRSIKIFMDGSLGSHSAALKENYNDKKNHKGTLVYTEEELFNILNKVTTNKFQPMIHAIGDLAVKNTINIYEKLNILNKNLKRPRIEHFQITCENDILRIKNLHILPSMQPMHSVADKQYIIKRIGYKRYENSFAWKKIIDKGIKIVAGSDSPFGDLNPFHGINAFINNYEPYTDNNLFCQNCISRENAIKAYTIWAAEGQFEENIKGSLEKGKYADFIVLDRNIFNCPVDDIRDTKVLKTFISGEEVFSF